MCKVLVVEDDALPKAVVCSFLEKTNFTYKAVSNAVESLFVIDKYKAIRIALIDLYLPGVDGLTLCRKIKSIDPLMITVAMTGFPTLFSVIECRQAGFDDILFKPLDLTLLGQLLLEYNAKLHRWQN